MRIFSEFSEFKSAVGTEIGASEWIEITQDRINRFAEATCDEQWVHVDQDRAKQELPGGKTIAHGLLSLSLAPMFIRSVMGLKALRTSLTSAATRFPTSPPSRPARGSGGVPASPKWRRSRPTACASTTTW